MLNCFSQRLTQLRESKELSKKQLAKILHVSDSCVSQYENASSMPGYDILLRISQFFGVSVDYLLGNDSNEFSIPLDVEFCNNITNYMFLSRCSKLPPAKRHALLIMVDALQDD